jgi:uncharacterized protein YciI
MEWERWVIELEQIEGVVTTADDIRAHVAHLRALEDAGVLVLAGPFPDDRAGMIILRVGSRAEAEAAMNADPFVSAGLRRPRLRRWMLSCEANNHLGRG